LYRYLEQRLREHVRDSLRSASFLGLPPEAFDALQIVVEQPPKIEFGEFAMPLAFELIRLAKKYGTFPSHPRKHPKQISEDAAAVIGELRGFQRPDVAGVGYINFKVDRGRLAAALVADYKAPLEIPPGKVLVEHSSINPNKAAHIGHLRNAILGDTFVRLLRAARREVDVQNYIDNTGAQVADVVVGFVDLEKKSRNDIESLAAAPQFDYVCWDLYARVSQWYEIDRQNLSARVSTLHRIEAGDNETAKIADLISTAVLRRHLETMDRLDIEYDFLPRESEILHLHFWDAAFTQLKDAGVLTFETQGKNKGCWIMRRAGTSKVDDAGGTGDAVATHIATAQGLGERASEIAEEDQKVIVRSNGTVGYVGKDIAYHMWKFGLLGRDFSYRKFFRYPNLHDCWISTMPDDPAATQDHPHFGDVAEIYNVIDARQSEAQNTVIEALRALGHNEAADRYTHFSYEMVALTPRCAAELGYELSEEDKQRSWIEVSGRKGFGVKADDLIDALLLAAGNEIQKRHPEIPMAERNAVAQQIATGALRYFMLKFTKSSVIAFDTHDALSFEGETGPYAQYAVVRAANIFRKGGLDPETFLREIAPHLTAQAFATYLDDADSNDIWELWLCSAKTSYVVGQCIATTEPAYLAKHAFQLAQLFNTFYHRRPILSESDERRKTFLLATAAVARRELIRVLSILGMTVPSVM
jgi:arginyl-tRNA synthetase